MTEADLLRQLQHEVQYIALDHDCAPWQVISRARLERLSRTKARGPRGMRKAMGAETWGAFGDRLAQVLITGRTTWQGRHPPRPWIIERP